MNYLHFKAHMLQTSFSMKSYFMVLSRFSQALIKVVHILKKTI